MFFRSGYRQAKRNYTKCFRTSYKFAQTHSLVYDISYYQLVTCSVNSNEHSILNYVSDFLNEFSDYVLIIQNKTSINDSIQADIYYIPHDEPITFKQANLNINDVPIRARGIDGGLNGPTINGVLYQGSNFCDDFTRAVGK